jgi:hypothetical protein
MQRRPSNRVENRAPRPFLLGALFFGLSLFGCNNYCFVFVSNPGGSISTSTPSCQLNSATGTVGLHISASPTNSTDAPAARIEHIYVTLRGIEAIASPIADDDSLDWRELAPKLATQPQQFDLLAPSADSCERSTIDYVTVPADAYRHIRMRLASNQPATDEAVPAENACGSIGLNCVVTTDGRIRPLVLDRLASQFEIPSQDISGGFFRVLPETGVSLDIEFNPQSTLIFSRDDPVRLVPVFTVEPRAFCESVASPDP